MLSNRQENILKFIVEEYIKSAKPISSHQICDKLECSSATIRNEMVYLEELKLLEKNSSIQRLEEMTKTFKSEK